MNTPIRIALLSFWHVHAQEYANEVIKHPDTELAAIWDENPMRGQAKALELGVPFVPDLESIWQDPSIAAIVLTSATREHHRLLLAAAKAGKHIYTEKVMAATTTEAKEIVGAIENARLKWMVSLPRLYAGYTRAIRTILASGRLGRITQARVRISHDGLLPSPELPNGWLPEHFLNPLEAAGGAMIDFGVHPMYLLQLFLGMPSQVSAHYGHLFGKPVEDNAAALLHYPDGTYGVAEVGFVNPHGYFQIEVHGTKALLHYGSPTNQLLVSSGLRGEPVVWEVIEIPADEPSPFVHWIEHLLRESDATRAVVAENHRLGIDLTALMEAANHAAKSGQSCQVSA